MQDGTDVWKTRGALRTTRQERSGGMETQGELRTTGQKARRTARKSWAAGAQIGVKSRRTERERRASSAQRNREGGRDGAGKDKAAIVEAGSTMLAGHSNKLNQTN